MESSFKKNEKPKKEQPPLFGLAIVSMFLIWGGLTFYIPVYFDLKNAILFNIIGFILLTISLVASLMEVSNIWKSEAYSYWGVAAIFIFPAILLHSSINYYEINNLWGLVIKIVVIILLFIGTPFVPVGFSYLLWKRKDKIEISEELRAENSSNKIQLVMSLVIAFLSFTTAIIQLVSQINN